jgi:flagellar biogenesis protein FliO
MYAELLTLVTSLADGLEKGPEPEDVKAGWVAFGLFLLLILAVVLLGISLVRRLRNVDRAEAEGRYDPSDRKQTPPDDLI